MPRRTHLRNLLQALHPSDPREAAHRQRMLELLEQTDAPFSREQSVPGHVTASAFVTNPARDALLLIFHSKLERWLQPGGHVEDDDADVLRAVQREVHEEAGLTPDCLSLAEPGIFDVDVHAIPARGEQPAHEHFDVRFLFTTRTADVIAGSDARDVRWVPVRELLSAPEAGEALLPTDDSVLRAVRKLAHGAA
jgi:8-oxo-dGTP pyrophosphatase MutT (NUDIX family)